jgi:hypothetical protein
MRGASFSGLILAASAGLLAPLCAPLLTRRVFVYNDLVWFHLPLRYLYQRALEAGDSVLWTPALFAGFYLHGEGQIGAFHPLHQFLYRLFPLGAAFNLEIIASYPAAFAGTFWFLRRLQFSRPAALFGAMLFAFSGFNLLHHHHINMVAIVAHLPWLLASADVLMLDDRTRARTLAFVAVAALLGSAFLLGFPQAVWWNLLALAAFCVFRASGAQRWTLLLPCAAAVVAGVLLGAVQLLPSAEAAAQSTRMRLPREFGLGFSLHPLNVLQLWSPRFFLRGAYSEEDRMVFHEFGVYSGAILQIALIWVWVRYGALLDRRRLIAAASAFAAIMFVLALGRYGGVATVLTYLPVLQSLRAPARHIVLVHFALAILAAVTFDDLLAIARGERVAPSGRRLAAIWIPAALGIATTAALNSHLLPYGPLTFANAPAAAAGVAVVVVVTLLVHLAGRRMRWAIAVLVVATAVDLALWGIRFVYREPARTIGDLTRAIPPAPLDPAESYAAAPDIGPYSGNLLVMRGYRLTTGYAGLFPASRHPLDNDLALRLSGTRWFFDADGSRRPAAATLGRVRLLDPDRREETGAARLVVDRPGLLVADVEAPGPGMLAFTERFHSGWSASTGDGPLQMVRVERDFLGCLVDRGAHRVTLRFLPRSFVYGSIVSAIGAALVAGVLLARLR